MDRAGLIPKHRTSFLRVKCSACGNEQTIFSHASRKLLCLVCNHELAAPKAAKIILKTKTVKEY